MGSEDDDDDVAEDLEKNTAPSSATPAASTIVVLALSIVALIYGAWSLIAKATLTGTGIAPLVLASYRCLGGAAVMLGAHHLTTNRAASAFATEGIPLRASYLNLDAPQFALLGIGLLHFPHDGP